MSAFSALPICLTPAIGCHLPTPPLPDRSFYTSGTPVFTSGDLVLWLPPQGMPFDCLVLGGQRTCAPRSHETVTVKEIVLGWLPLPGHCTESRQNMPPSFWERGLFACPGTVAWGACFWFGTLTEACGGALKKQGLVSEVFALSFCLTPAFLYLTGELRLFSGALIFVAAARGQLYIAWLWWPEGPLLRVAIGL